MPDRRGEWQQRIKEDRRGSPSARRIADGPCEWSGQSSAEGGQGRDTPARRSARRRAPSRSPARRPARPGRSAPDRADAGPTPRTTSSPGLGLELAGEPEEFQAILRRERRPDHPDDMQGRRETRRPRATTGGWTSRPSLVWFDGPTPGRGPQYTAMLRSVNPARTLATASVQRSRRLRSHGIAADQPISSAIRRTSARESRGPRARAKAGSTSTTTSRPLRAIKRSSPSPTRCDRPVPT